MEYAVEMRHIRKQFRTVVANDDVSLAVRPGTVHAVIGENGAGKTTLMNILYGLYLPDAGQILIDGKERHLRSATDAISCGIGMVHQHCMLIPRLSVADNVVLGSEPKKGLRYDRQAAAEAVARVCREYGPLHRSQAAGPGDLSGDAAAGGDREDALPRCQHHHLG